MELTTKDILKFQQLFKARFNVDVDQETARRKLSSLVRQMELVYRPVSKDQLDELKDENNDSQQKA